MGWLMPVAARVMARARAMEPGGFALVMATGVVSVDLTQHGMLVLGKALFWLNWAAYLWLLLISTLRFIFYRDEMVSNFVAPGRGAAFLTMAAGTCVLAIQCLLVVYLPLLARIIAVWGALCWVVLIYLFFFSTMTRRVKAPFSATINGSWLVVVVATQALAVLIAILAQDGALAVREWLLFAAMSLYLIGCAWYLVIITLITYRMVLLPLVAREFTPPYWINMGALAISALAGSLIILHAPAQGPLHDLLPFVKGFSLLYWAMATWWIPLLVILELWRHVWSRVPVNYEVDDWDIVFPVGMYTVCTATLSRATGAEYLMVIPDVGVYVSFLLWAVVGAGLAYRLLHRRRDVGV
ncbi:MAG: C4-dicarboxylate ABC transporter [Castellaniella sp.]|uniref:tellurite resistance/C4-dicarboxylate transporter family protein n=1 Tax=Castellaniella sp. TaxID=1955812 RepID=UPI0011FEBCEA|nr:tellurite resistance/C4-dicarboxylate transporter family protein [Castellaniella sp.]TAN29987.1 MAG: C4-dicarboxylate ABC transporter [Castellaniella sp.]